MSEYNIYIDDTLTILCDEKMYNEPNLPINRVTHKEHLSDVTQMFGEDIERFSDDYPKSKGDINYNVIYEEELGPVRITSLPKELIDIICDYLSLIDAYNLCITTRSLYQLYDRPTFGLAMCLELEHNKLLNKTVLKSLMKNLENFTETIHVTDSNIFKKPKFNKIFSPDLYDIIDKLIYSSNDSAAEVLEKIQGSGFLEINDNSWDLLSRDTNNDNHTTVQLMPYDYNRPTEGTQFDIDIQNQKFITLLPKMINSISNSLDKYDWKNTHLVENININKEQKNWNIPIDFNKERKLDYRWENVEDINGYRLALKKVIDESKLKDNRFLNIRKFSTTNGKYLILLPSNNIDFKDHKNDITISCYKMNNSNNSILSWEANLSTNNINKLQVSIKVKPQISRHFAIIPIEMITHDLELNFYWLIFELASGNYIGSYKIPFDDLEGKVLENFHDNNYLINQLYLYGSHIFIVKNKFSFHESGYVEPSGFQLLTTTFESFLKGLEIDSEIKVHVKAIDQNTQDSSSFLANRFRPKIKNAADDNCGTNWKILFETADKPNCQYQFGTGIEELEIDHKKTLFYIWNNKIALQMNYEIKKTRSSGLSRKEYLFLYDLETYKRKYIELDVDWQSRMRNGMIMVDDYLNFVVVGKGFVSVPI